MDASEADRNNRAVVGSGSEAVVHGGGTYGGVGASR